MTDHKEDYETKMTMVKGAPAGGAGDASEPQHPRNDDSSGSAYVTGVTMIGQSGSKPENAEAPYSTDVTMVGQKAPAQTEGQNSAYVTGVTMVGQKAPAQTEGQSSPNSTDVTMIGGKSSNGTKAMPESAKKTRDSMYSLSIGDMLGKYKIESRLGRGGMGEVYLARHTTLEVPRAIKLLPAEIMGRDPQFVDRFIREAKLACSIRHANVVNVMDVEKDDERGFCYIVMEYVDGGNVRDIMRSSKMLSEQQAAVIIAGVAEALAAAAEFKIVHRDIKPDNIMLTKRGDVKLADLGIAKTTAEDVSLTVSHVMMGTPAYLSPEQAKDAKNVDARADIYSLGATFYEMVTGQLPYPGSSAYDILSKLFTDPVPDPRSINPAISAPTAKLIMKMLDKNPANRFQSAIELLEEIDKLGIKPSGTEAHKLIRSALGHAEGDATFPTPASTIKKHSVFRQKSRVLIFVSAAILFLVVAGGIAKMLMFQGKDEGTSTTVRQPEKQPVRQTQPTKTEEPAKGIDQTQPEPQKTEVAEPDTRQKPETTAQAEQSRPTTPKPVECTWKIRPPGAKVTLKEKNGDIILETKVSEDSIIKFIIMPGNYQAVISCRGYTPQTLPLIVTDSGLNAVPVKLDEQRGDLIITTVPNATVSVFGPGGKVKDGKTDSRGMLALKSIPTGSYTLEAVCDGYNKYQTQITVEDTTETKLELVMDKPLKTQPSQQTQTPVSQTTTTATQNVSYARLGDGKISISVKGDPAVVEYVNQKGGEIKINSDDWVAIRKFPYESTIRAGTYKVRINIAGIQQMPTEEIKITANTTNTVVFHAFPEPAQLAVACNVQNAEICIDKDWLPAKAPVSVSAFKDYTLKARAPGCMPQEQKITGIMPGEIKQVSVTLNRKGIPFQQEYEQGMQKMKAKDYEEAAEIFKPAAEGGNPGAAYQLGVINEKGLGMWFSDENEAFKWYKAAADLGHADGLYKTGLFHEEGRGKAEKALNTAAGYYMKAAEQKHQEALFKVAQMYETGTGGLSKNEKLATEYCRLAAEKGQPEAQYLMGFRYENGKGVPVNIPTAVEWYKKSAAQGNEKASHRASVLKNAYRTP